MVQFEWLDDSESHSITKEDNLRVFRIMYLVDRGMSIIEATKCVDGDGQHCEVYRKEVIHGQ